MFFKRALLVAASTAAASSFLPATASAQPTAPALVGSPANPSGSASPSFTYSSSYAQVTFECRLDAGAYAACPGYPYGGATSGTQSYSGVADGSHTFDVRALDLFGNAGPAASYAWTADLVAPALSLPANVTVQSPLGGSKSVSYSVTASDNHDSSPSISCDRARTGGVFVLGTTTVHCSATDAAGNSSSGSFTVSVVDSTPPKAPSFSSRPASPSADTGPSFGVQTNEPATFRCRLDTAAFATCSSTTSYTGVADGGHTFAVYAIDASGNVGATSTYNWTLDTIAPVLTVPAPIAAEAPTGYSASVSYTVSATDNHDPNPKVSCTYPKTGYTFPFGTTTVICTATDWVANSTTASFTIVVNDTTPPDTPQLYGPSNPSGASAYFYYYTNEVNVTWECSLDGAAFAGCGASYGSYSGLADGNHTFQVRAVDGSGNVGADTSFAWLADTVAPTLSVPANLTAQSPLGNAVHVPYAVGAADNHDPNPWVYCDYGSDGGWFSVGTTTVNCKAYDWAGNASSSGSFTVTVEDHVAPDAPAINGPQDPSNNASPSFSYYTNEWNVSWECSVDSAAFAPCGSGYTTLSGLADGTHTFAARATDASGNAGASSSYTWTIDTVPPVITVPAAIVAQSPQGSYVHVSYTVTATDDRDPSPWFYCNYGSSGSWFTVGTSIVTCYANDNAGNSASASFTVTVEDHVPPNAPAVYGPQDPSNNASPSFYYYTNEWNVSWECSVDSAAFAPCGSGYTTLSGLADGTHTFAARATDASGNAGASSSYTWTIDTVSPVITVPAAIVAQSPLGGYVQVPYTVGAADDRDPNPNVYCYGGARNGGYFPVGTTTVTCYAYDQAGNSATGSFTVTVEDNVPPDRPTVVGPASPTTATTALFWYSTNDWSVGWTCSLDGAPLAPCGGWGYASYAGLGDGAHTFTVRATDSSGNFSESSYPWTVDLVAPTLSTPGPLTVESPDGNAVDVSYSVSAVDGHDANPSLSCDYATASGGWFSLGTTIVTCSSSDYVGNTSSESFTVTVQDTTPPDATVDTAPSDPSGDASAAFDVSTDETASLQCSLDGAPSSACTSPVTYSGLADGSHAFSVYAIDTSGNVGSTTTTTWLVDLGAPSLSSPGDVSVEAPLGAAASVSYSVGAVDAHDASPSLVCDHGTRAGGVFALGATTVTCTATDWVGNSSSTSFTVTVADTTPPVAPAIAGPSDPSNVASPTLSYSTNEHDASFRCSLDGSVFASCPGNPVAQGTEGSSGYNSLADGAHTFQVLAIDSSGNVGPAAAFSWTVDLAPPVLTVPAPVPVESPLGADAAVSYTVTAVDGHDASPAIACDRGSAAGGTFPLGTTTVTCTATDAAGNTSASQSFTVTVADTTPPSSPALASKPGDPSGLDSADFGYSTNEPASFECSLDGAPYAACGSSSSYGGLADGAHTFEVRATDLSGNVGPSTSYAWTVDLAAPVLTVPGPVSAESALGGVVHVAYAVSAVDAHDPNPAIACDHGDASGGDFGLGATTVTCTATDAAGNASASQSFTVDVADTTAPTTTITAEPADPSADPAPSFSFVADEPAAFECRLDGAAFAPCSSPVDYAGLAAGSHTFEVRAIDLAGNVGPVAGYSWTQS